MAALAQCAAANPTGHQVAAGSATVSASGKTVTVTNTPGAILNWQSFSIAPGELTRFVQQSSASAILNRVVASNPSSILGTLQSNGRVFLVNPHGIVVGAGAFIDTAGFVASTLNIADKDFLAGRLKFEGGGAGVLRNEGTIRASGDIFLVGPQIENAASGIIHSTNGDVLLAAGKSVTITSPDAHGVQFGIQAPEDAVVNLGAIQASNAVGLFAGTLKHSGEIKVTSASLDSAGRVVLSAQGDTILDGNAKIAVDSSVGKGGKVAVLGEHVGLFDKATITATGAAGGGEILVGGDYQGKNPDVRNAFVTYFAPDARLDASATANGNGGKVILWADHTTQAHGHIAARGGPDGGNGGFVETSGKVYLDATRAPDIGAPTGKGGTWLLDPANLAVDPGGTDSNISTTNAPPNTTFQPVDSVGPSLSVNTLQNAIAAANGGTIEISTQQTGNITDSGNGDITFNVKPDFNPLTAAGATLKLNAHRGVTFTAGLQKSGANPLTIVFTENTAGPPAAPTGDSVYTITGGITSTGNLTLSSTVTPIIFTGNQTLQSFTLASGSLATFNTAVGPITIDTGTVNIAGTATLSGTAGNNLLGGTGTVLNIQAGGVLNIATDNTGLGIPIGPGGVTPQLNILPAGGSVAGQLNKSAGAGTSVMGWVMNNQGLVSSSSGTLQIAPPLNTTSTTTGTLNVGTGAFLDLQGTSGAPPLALHQLGDNALLTGGGTFAYSGTSNSLVLTGTALGAGATIANGATLTLQSGKQIDATAEGKLTNLGTLGLPDNNEIHGLVINGNTSTDGIINVGSATTAIFRVNGLTMVRGNMNFAGPATFRTNGQTFLWQGGALNKSGGGTATIDTGTALGAPTTGTGPFTAGTAGGAITHTIGTGIAINASLNTTAINNFVTLNVNGGRLDAGTTTINNGGTLTYTAGTVNQAGGFNNSGTFNMNAGGTTMTLPAGGTGTGGKFNVATTAIINFNDGTFSLTDGQLNGPGSYTLTDGAILNLNNVSSVTALTGFDSNGRLNINGTATSTINGPLTLSSDGTTVIANGATLASGNVDWQQGVLGDGTATGTFNINGTLTIPAGATDAVTGPSVAVSGMTTVGNGSTLQLNTGSLNLNGGSDLTAGGTLLAALNRTITLGGPADPAPAATHSLGTTGFLTGQGTIAVGSKATLSGADGITQTIANITNAGTIRLHGITLQSNVTQTAGLFEVDTGSENVTGTTFSLQGGELRLPAGTSFTKTNGPFNWVGGTLSGGGTLTSANFQITGTGVRVLDGLTLDLSAGPVALSAGVGNSLEVRTGTLKTGAFTNNATLLQTGGIFQPTGLDISNGATFTYSGGAFGPPSGNVNNKGTLNVTAGTLALPTGGTHTDGIFNVAGTLNFTGGTHTFDGASAANRLTGSGTYGVVGATTQLDFTAPTVTVAGTFNNGGTVNVHSGTVSLTNGGTHGSNFNVANNATLTLSGNHIYNTSAFDVDGALTFGTGTHTLNGGTLNGSGSITNAGTMNVTANATSTGVTFIQSGTLNLNSNRFTKSGGLFNFADGTITGTGILEMTNNAIFRTTGAGTTKTISGGNSIDLITLHAQEGTLAITGTNIVAINNSAAPDPTLPSVVLDAGSIVNVDGTVQLNVNAGRFNNDAILTLKQGGTQNLTLGFGGYSKGTFIAETGKQILFSGGTHQFENAQLNGAGDFVFSGATVSTEMSPSTATGTGQVRYTGGTLALNQNFTKSGGSFVWQPSALSTLSGTGTLLLNGGATLSASGVGEKRIDGPTLTAGQVNVQGGMLRLMNGALANAGSLTISNTAALQIDGGTFTATGVLDNNGTFTLNAGAVDLTAGGTHTNGIFNVGAGTTLRFSGAHDLAGTTQLNGLGTVSITGGAVNVNSNVTAGVTNFDQDGGTVTIADGQTLTKDGGTYRWSAGNLGGTGTFSFINGGTFSIGGTGARIFNDLTLNLGAPTLAGPAGNSLTIQSGTINTSGVFTNNGTLILAGGTFKPTGLNNAGTFSYGSGTFTPQGGAAVNNTGLVHVTAGTLSLPTSGTHTGTFNVDGTLNFTNNSTHSFSNTAVLNGAGTYGIVGANTTLDFNGPTYNATGAFNNGGILNVHSGTLNLTGGGTHGSQFNVANGAILGLSGAQIYNNSTFAVDGTLNFASGAQTLNGGTFSGAGAVNNAGATLNLTADAASSVASFNQNAGTLALGAVLTQNGGSFNWTGGTLGGTGAVTTAGGATFNMTGASARTLNGPTLNLGATTLAAGAGNSLTIQSGTINTSGVFTNNGTLILAGGTFKPTGLNNAGTFSYGSGTFTPQGGAAVNNTGLVHVTAGTLSLPTSGTHTGTFNVDGTLNFTNNSTHSFSNTAVLNGAGTYGIVGANTTLDFNGPTYNATGAFNNGGILNVHSGTLNLTGGGTHGSQFNVANGAILGLSGAQIYNNSTFAVDGTLNFASGAQTLNGGTFSGAGAVNNAGATLNLTADAASSVASFNQNAGTLTLGAALTQNGGSFNWTGGTLGGTGAVTTAGGATFNMTGASARTLNGPTLNLGATTLAAGAGNSLTIQSGTLRTSGVFTNNGSLSLTGGTFSPTGMENAGTFAYSGGIFAPQSGAAVNNNTGGVVHVMAGTLALSTNGTHTGTFNVDGNALLDITGGAHTFGNTSTITIAANGRFDATGGTSTFNAGSKITGAGEYWIKSSAAGVIFNGVTLDPTVIFDNDGPLTVQSGTVNLPLSGGAGNPHNGSFNVADGAVLNFTAGPQAFTNATFNPSDSGIIAFTGGTHTFAGTTQLIGTGTVRMGNGSTVNVNADTTAAVNLFQQTGGTLNILASRTLTKSGGTYAFEGGQINGPGTLTMANSAVFSTANTGDKTLNNMVVNALGIHAAEGTLILQDTSLTAATTSTADTPATIQINGTSAFTASAAFNNSGTFKLTGGTATLAGGGAHSNGTFDVAAGTTINFSGGTHILDNSLLSGAGTIALTAGNLQVAPPSTSVRSGGVLSMAGGTSIDGAGTFLFANDATLDLSASGVKTINGPTLTVPAVNVSAGRLDLLGGKVTATGNATIAAGATLRMNGALFFVLGTTFDNAGTLDLASGAVDFGGLNGTHTGIFNAAAGTSITFSGGTHVLNGAQLNGAGTVVQSGGVLQVANNVTSSVNTLQLTGGQFTVDAGKTFTKDGGTFAWEAGTIGGGGTLGGINNPTITYPGSGARIFNGPTATVNNITLGGGSLTVQSGTLNVSGATSVGANANLGMAGGTLNTAGSFNVSGTLNNNAVINNTNPIMIQTGGTVSGAGSFFGDIVNVAGTLSPGNSPGTMVIHGDYTQMANGVLLIDIEGTQQGMDYDFVNITGTANLAGTLQIRNGSEGSFIPAASDTFTFMQYASRVGDFTNFVYPVGLPFTPRPGATTYAVTPGAQTSNSSTTANNGATNEVIALKEQEKTIDDVAVETREDDKNKVKGVVCK